MKKGILTIFIATGVFLVSASGSAVHAQYFKFNLLTPQNQVSVGQSVQVQILINTLGQQTINGDALITYDPAGATITSADNTNFFTYFSATPLGGAQNKYLVSSWEESVAHQKSSSADTPFATLNFTLKSSCTTFSLDCTAGTESDSNINRSSDSKDIIVCPLTPITVCAAGASTSAPVTPSATAAPTTPVGPTNTPMPTFTPTPTNTPIPTNTPRPTATPHPIITSLPRMGSSDVTIWGLGIGALFVVVGGLIFVL